MPCAITTTGTPTLARPTILILAAVVVAGALLAVGLRARSHPTAVTPSAAIGAVPSPVDFGAQTLGSDSGLHTVVITNQGRRSSVAAVRSVMIGGTDAGDFALVANDCLRVRVPAGQACSVEVSFHPTALGTRQARLMVARSDAGTSLTVALSGQGTLSPVTAQPPTVDFGQVNTGSTSTPQAVTLTNSSAAPVAIGAITVSGIGAAGFTAAAQACTGVTLAPGSHCQVTVSFAPATDGDDQAELAFAHDGAGSLATVGLAGAGAPLKLHVSPSGLAFGLQRVGTPGTPLVVTISTPLMSVVPIGTVVLSGPAASDFSVLSNGCTGVTVAPASSCTLTVVFTPSRAGAELATLTVDRAREATAAATLPVNGFGTSR